MTYEDPMTVNEMKALSIGDRVAFPKGIDAYPDFIIRDHVEGAVTEIEDDCLWVKLDDHNPDLDEWDNKVQVWFWANADGTEESGQTVIRKEESK